MAVFRIKNESFKISLFHLVIHFKVLPCPLMVIIHFLIVLNNIPLSRYIIVYSASTQGHLGCFQVLSNMNKTAINSVQFVSVGNFQYL